MGFDVNFRTFGETQSSPFFGPETMKGRSISQKTAEMVDDEITKLIRRACVNVRRILNDNRDKLSNLAEKLFEKETLSAEEIDEILKES